MKSGLTIKLLSALTTLEFRVPNNGDCGADIKPLFLAVLPAFIWVREFVSLE